MQATAGAHFGSGAFMYCASIAHAARENLDSWNQFWVGALGIAFDRKFISWAALLCGIVSGAMQIRFGCPQNAHSAFVLKIKFYIQHHIHAMDFWILFRHGIPKKAFNSKLNSRSKIKFSSMPGAKQMRIWLLCGTLKFICSASWMVQIPEFCLGMASPKRPLTAN